MSSKKTINIFGVTGSVGRCAVDVILKNPEYFDVRAVSAYRDVEGLAFIARELKAETVILVDPSGESELRNLLSDTSIRLKVGAEALQEEASESVDITLGAIVGMTGLDSTVAAIQASKAVAIANKEPLVSAGHVVLDLASQYQTTVLPVDSEHNALFQIFDSERREDIESVILTASGGPFLRSSLSELSCVTPAQAVAHPNWSMGPKISVDSATMMNKALEIIEAYYLFGVPANSIQVLVHPQSVVHAMVSYKDGSVLAQMGASDMRTPLANVLAWPERLCTPGKKLSYSDMSKLSFEEPDFERFPAIKMAYACLDAGPYACIGLNAANEVAVDHFLQGRIAFLDIMDTVQYALDSLEPRSLEFLSTLEEIKTFDARVRTITTDYINRNTFTKAVASL